MTIIEEKDLPEFLYIDDWGDGRKVRIGYNGGTNVTEEFQTWLKKYDIKLKI